LLFVSVHQSEATPWQCSVHQRSARRGNDCRTRRISCIRK